MAPPKHPLAITDAEFERALREAYVLDEVALIRRTGAHPARSYFVRFRDRIFPLKAALRLAYDMAGQRWDYMQSASAARQLRGRFDILYITDKSEQARLDRQRQTAERWARPGQAKFRVELLELYQSQCAVTGCAALDAIDAAHIVGVDGGGSDKASNGIILRADLHRLFDSHLMAIDPAKGSVHFHQCCRDHYQEIEGREARWPEGGPKPSLFLKRWQLFHKKVPV